MFAHFCFGNNTYHQQITSLTPAYDVFHIVLTQTLGTVCFLYVIWKQCFVDILHYKRCVCVYVLNNTPNLPRTKLCRNILAYTLRCCTTSKQQSCIRKINDARILQPNTSFKDLLLCATRAYIMLRMLLMFTCICLEKCYIKYIYVLYDDDDDDDHAMVVGWAKQWHFRRTSQTAVEHLSKLIQLEIVETTLMNIYSDEFSIYRAPDPSQVFCLPLYRSRHTLLNNVHLRARTPLCRTNEYTCGVNIIHAP